MRTLLFPMSRRTPLHLLAGAVTLVAITACAESPVSPSAESADLTAIEGALFARAPQVSVCHGNGSGAYMLLTINANATAAHQAHGDGAPGDAVPDGSGAIFSADCVPQTQDIPGTYILQSLGGQPLPTLGTGEILHAATLVLSAGGDCSLSVTSQPDDEIMDFIFQDCSYALDGTELTVSAVDEEGEPLSLPFQVMDDHLVLQILVWDDGDENDEGVLEDAVFVKVDAL